MTTSLLCLAFAIYFEARSESLVGQYAVADVIMNRVESPRFPDDVCGVVTEDRGPRDYDCQFSFYCDGKPEEAQNKDAWALSKEVAQSILDVPDGPDYSGDALFYHTIDVSPGWSSRMDETARHGVHVFFTDEVILADN